MTLSKTTQLQQLSGAGLWDKYIRGTDVEPEEGTTTTKGIQLEDTTLTSK